MNPLEIVIIAIILLVFFAVPQILMKKMQRESLIFPVTGIPHRAANLIRALYFAALPVLYLLNKFVMHIEFNQFRYVNLTFMAMAIGLSTIIQFYNYLVVMDKKGIRGFRWKIKWSEIEGYSIDRERSELVIKGSKQRVIGKIRKANWTEVEKMLVERVPA